MKVKVSIIVGIVEDWRCVIYMRVCVCEEKWLHFVARHHIEAAYAAMTPQITTSSWKKSRHVVLLNFDTLNVSAKRQVWECRVIILIGLNVLEVGAWASCPSSTHHRSSPLYNENSGSKAIKLAGLKRSVGWSTKKTLKCVFSQH